MLVELGDANTIVNAALFFAVPQMRVPDGALDGTVGTGLLTVHVLYLDLHSKHFWMTS